MWGNALPFREWVPWQTRQEAVSERWPFCAGTTGSNPSLHRRASCEPRHPLPRSHWMNLVSPTGFILTGPSARYIEPHSIKTVWVMLGPGSSSLGFAPSVVVILARPPRSRDCLSRSASARAVLPFPLRRSWRLSTTVLQKSFQYSRHVVPPRARWAYLGTTRSPPRGTDGLQTPCWRKQNSNPRSLGYCAAGASRNSQLPASVETVKPLRRATVKGELFGQ
jgi:hypothetical protein